MLNIKYKSYHVLWCLDVVFQNRLILYGCPVSIDSLFSARWSVGYVQVYKNLDLKISALGLALKQINQLGS